MRLGNEEIYQTVAKAIQSNFNLHAFVNSLETSEEAVEEIDQLQPLQLFLKNRIWTEKKGKQQRWR